MHAGRAPAGGVAGSCRRCKRGAQRFRSDAVFGAAVPKSMWEASECGPGRAVPKMHGVVRHGRNKQLWYT
jgi:hypothetical protein